MSFFASVEFPPMSNVVEWPTKFGIGFNKISVICILGFLIPTVLFALGRGGKLVPTGIQNFVESIVEFVEEQIAKPGIGVGFERYVPLLTAFFTFIFIANITEVIPFFQMPGNARMALPLVLALVSWVMFISVGLKHHGMTYVKDVVWPPSIDSVGMKAFVGFIEFFSVFLLRPFSHAVRLFANMLAGHILLITFAVLTIATIKSGVLIFIPAIGSFVGLVGFTAFEVGVSLIQAFVFSILASVYIGSSLHPAH